MSCITKIFIFKVESVSGNGFISFSPSINKGFSANSKAVGGQRITGKAFRSKNIEKNIVSDPDFIDQSMKNKKKAIV